MRMYLEGLSHDDWSVVHFFIDDEKGNTRFIEAVQDGRLNGGRSAERGEKGGVNAYRSQAGDIEKGFGQYLSVGGDKEKVGADITEGF